VRLCSCQVALLHRGPGGMENALLMCETEFIKGVGLVVKAREREGGREGYVREGSGGREGKEGRSAEGAQDFRQLPLTSNLALSFSSISSNSPSSRIPSSSPSPPASYTAPCNDLATRHSLQNLNLCDTCVECQQSGAR